MKTEQKEIILEIFGLCVGDYVEIDDLRGTFIVQEILHSTSLKAHLIICKNSKFDNIVITYFRKIKNMKHNNSKIFTLN